MVPEERRTMRVFRDVETSMGRFVRGSRMSALTLMMHPLLLRRVKAIVTFLDVSSAITPTSRFSESRYSGPQEWTIRWLLTEKTHVPRTRTERNLRRVVKVYICFHRRQIVNAHVEK